MFMLAARPYSSIIYSGSSIEGSDPFPKKRILKFIADNLGTVSSKTHALLAGIRALVKEARIRFISGRPRKRAVDDRQMALPGFWGGRQGRLGRDSARGRAAELSRANGGVQKERETAFSGG